MPLGLFLQDKGLGSLSCHQNDLLMGIKACRLAFSYRIKASGLYPATTAQQTFIPLLTLLLLVLACWNVRSLGIHTDLQSSSPRKSAVIDLELTRLGISACALSETWLTGSGSIREANFSFFWSGYPDNARPMHGVGLAIQNSLLPCIEQPGSISPRLMSMRIRLSSGFVTVISAYAPTLMAEPVEKDEFYQQLDDTLLSIAAGDSIVLAGDFNARTGSDYRSWSGVIGPHGLGNMNDNGQRLLEYCASHDLCLTSTFFAGSPRSKATWMHPRSHRWHQLDHIIMTRKRQLGDVKHCRSMHSTDCNTDHALVRCKLRMQPKKFHQAHPRPSPAVDTTATLDFMRVTKFQELLTDQFSSSPTPNSPGPAWSRLKSTVTDCTLTARFTPALHRLCFVLPRVMLTLNTNCYWSGLSARIQHCADSGDLRGLYNGIKEAIGPTPKKSAPLLSASGEILTDPSAQLDRWAHHYSYLYANDAEVIPDALTSLPHFSTLHELDSDITLDAMKHAISGLKNNKSPGADGIPPEVLKCGGVALTTELFNVFLLCWHSHWLPQDLKDANIITIYKNKGNRQDCNNYRGISQLSIAGKIFARVLLPRLQVIANRILPESQCGFRSSRSTVDMVFSLRQLQEKCVEQQRPLYVVLLTWRRPLTLSVVQACSPSWSSWGAQTRCSSLWDSTTTCKPRSNSTAPNLRSSRSTVVSSRVVCSFPPCLGSSFRLFSIVLFLTLLVFCSILAAQGSSSTSLVSVPGLKSDVSLFENSCMQMMLLLSPTVKQSSNPCAVPLPKPAQACTGRMMAESPRTSSMANLLKPPRPRADPDCDIRMSWNAISPLLAYQTQLGSQLPATVLDGVLLFTTVSLLLPNCT